MVTKGGARFYLPREVRDCAPCCGVVLGTRYNRPWAFVSLTMPISDALHLLNSGFFRRCAILELYQVKEMVSWKRLEEWPLSKIAE